MTYIENKRHTLFSYFSKRTKPPFPVVSVPSGGKIGLAPCPGMKESVNKDISSYDEWGAKIVISLVETKELQQAGAEDLGHLLKQRKIEWFHVPIQDCMPPSLNVRAQWLDLKLLLKYHLRDKKERILLHCWAGVGRAGMIAAKLLMQSGMATDDAIAHVRSVQPDAIDTAGQVDWLYQPNW